MPRLLLALLLATGCTQSATALRSSDASTDVVTLDPPDGGVIANLCAHPELFDGAEVTLTVTGIQRSNPSCTAAGCIADAGVDGADGGIGGCCNSCDAYWVLPCPSEGQIALFGYDFNCYGNECSLNCALSLSPSDAVRLHATVHTGGVPGSCCAPVRFGISANATLNVIDYTVTSQPDS